MTTIAILSSKGGVGKTSLAVLVAQAWRDDSVSKDKPVPVLLADLDPQGSATSWAQMSSGWRDNITVISIPRMFAVNKQRVEYAHACSEGSRLNRGAALTDIESLLDELLAKVA